MVYKPGLRRALAQRGGDEIARQSVLGAGITTLLSTLSTGNPLAGLAVGGTDLLLSSAIGRAMAGKMIPTGKGIRSGIPGLYGSYETKYLAPGAGGVTQRFKEQVAAGKSPWKLVTQGPRAGSYMK